MPVKQPNSVRMAAITHSKLRNEYGLVAVEVRIKERLIYPKLVREWPIESVNVIPGEVYNYYQLYRWAPTYVDQLSGEFLIAALKRLGVPVKVITTQKNLKDSEPLQRVEVMDMIEGTELLRKLKINGQVRFPEKPTDNMKKLEAQLPFFAKHTTEAGSVDYYAPGAEPDALVRCMIMDVFGARKLIGEGSGGGPTVAGPIGGRRGRGGGGLIRNLTPQTLIWEGSMDQSFLDDIG